VTHSSGARAPPAPRGLRSPGLQTLAPPDTPLLRCPHRTGTPRALPPSLQMASPFTINNKNTWISIFSARGWRHIYVITAKAKENQPSHNLPLLSTNQYRPRVVSARRTSLWLLQSDLSIQTWNKLEKWQDVWLNLGSRHALFLFYGDRWLTSKYFSSTKPPPLLECRKEGLKDPQEILSFISQAPKKNWP